MQRLLDSVVRGSCWYVSGSIPLDRAPRFAAKLAGRYGVDRNKNQRAYARRQGAANARLLLLRRSESTDLLWWLIATSGEGAVHEQETLLDAREKRSRLRLDDDYELVRTTRPRKHGGGTVWTWRMTRSSVERWRVRLIQACRRGDDRDLRVALASLRRTPGFSGVRRQVGQLVTLARGEWRRRHAQTEFPQLSRLGYVERLRDVVVPLSVLSKSMCKAPAFAQKKGGVLARDPAIE